MKTAEKVYLMDITRDIVVAKLSQSAPNYSDERAGKSISNMYEEIYNKLCTIYESKDVAGTE